ncbi:hypothetical protein H4219_006333 [Mycoemilia scoparia]|uniref:Chromo domain-containing protein n=1 Tax=Mycoemilia scoparia TaxID=417184 RepID=A0A9W8DMV3_9FUNG|nr:hypothetical protein H4219_006333 [Mycoemilia scoparia]
MFGRSFNFPLDFSGSEPVPSIDLALLCKFRDLIIHASVARHLSDYQFEAKRRFDNAKALLNLSVGDTVLARIFPKPHRNLPQFDGPFTVDRITMGGSYVLRSEGGELLPRKYALSQLVALDREPTPLKDHYEIDYIKASRAIDGKEEFLVHRRGYGSDDDTWENIDAFPDKSILDGYKRTTPRINKINIHFFPTCSPSPMLPKKSRKGKEKEPQEPLKHRTSTRKKRKELELSTSSQVASTSKAQTEVNREPSPGTESTEVSATLSELAPPRGIKPQGNPKKESPYNSAKEEWFDQPANSPPPAGKRQRTLCRQDRARYGEVYRDNRQQICVNFGDFSTTLSEARPIVLNDFGSECSRNPFSILRNIDLDLVIRAWGRRHPSFDGTQEYRIIQWVARAFRNRRLVRAKQHELDLVNRIDRMIKPLRSERWSSSACVPPTAPPIEETVEEEADDEIEEEEIEDENEEEEAIDNNEEDENDDDNEEEDGGSEASTVESST